jgi:CO dehydrogenase maturation factor
MSIKMKLAVTGKGGVGKTTLAAGIAIQIAQAGGEVYALDADPDSNLASGIGFPPELVADLVPLSELKDLIRERTGAEPGYGGMFQLNPKVDDIPERYSREHRGVKLMVMGGVQFGGAGCVCPESIVIKRLLEEFLIYRDTSVILDMEAGLEHLGRGTAQSMGTLVVVVEPGMRSVETARTVKRLAADLRIPVVKVVGNKVRNDADRRFLESSFPEDDLLGCISYDERLIDADRDGVSPFDIGAEKFADEINVIVAALQSSSDDS